MLVRIACWLRVRQISWRLLKKLRLGYLFLAWGSLVGVVIGAQAGQVATSFGLSFQVNVDASGHNILGDAANEPSMCIDPTNPDHMSIGWRQFDTATNNFRQSGWAYSTNGGLAWT